jgi:hypothetical protein
MTYPDRPAAGDPVPVTPEGLRACSGSFLQVTVAGQRRDVVIVDVDGDELVVRPFDPGNPGDMPDDERLPLTDVTAAAWGPDTTERTP